MRFLRIFLAVAFLAGLSPVAHAAESAQRWITGEGDLLFNRGGIRGEYLIFQDWLVTKDYTLNTVIKHSGAIWVALTDPAIGDEPGTAAAWEKITDQTGTGGGLSLTAGTANPTGGSDGDAYLQVDTSVPAEIQAIWRNVSSTWTPYALPAGADGAAGAAGADGAAGAAGAEGPTGPAGAAGAAGSDGNDGATGAAGADGATGPVGPEGPAGADGSGGTALTQDQVEDPTDTTIGSVSGQRMGQSIDENSPVEELRGDVLGDADDYDSYTIKTNQGDLFVVHPTQVGHSITFTEYETFRRRSGVMGF